MKKKKVPEHLKIVTETKKTSPQQLQFFDLGEQEEERQDYDPDELTYLLQQLDRTIDRSIRKNTVRNRDDLYRLRDNLITFKERMLRPLEHKVFDFLAWVALPKFYKRLSEIDYRIKRDSYEEILTAPFEEFYLILIERMNTEDINTALDFLFEFDEYHQLPANWFVMIGSVFSVIPYIAFFPKTIYDFSKDLLKKVFTQGLRQQTFINTEILSNYFHVYLVTAIQVGKKDSDIERFIAGHEFDYGIFTHYLDFKLSDVQLKDVYQLLKAYQKNNNLRFYYSKMDPEENARLRNSVYAFLYHALCLNHFDYYENIFPFYTRLTKDPEQYFNLFLLYHKYASPKRVQKYLEKIYSKDSPLTHAAQKVLRKAIYEKR